MIILDNIVVQPAENKNMEERVSFEEILLKTIARNDIPKTPRKRISHGAEILTYKDTLHRMKKDKEDNEKAKETIRLNKLKRASKTNNKKITQKKAQKTNRTIKNKRRKYSVSDSESDCSYSSMNSSEDDNIDGYLQAISEESNNEDLQEPLPSTSKKQEIKKSKIKRPVRETKQYSDKPQEKLIRQPSVSIM